MILGKLQLDLFQYIFMNFKNFNYISLYVAAGLAILFVCTGSFIHQVWCVPAFMAPYFQGGSQSQDSIRLHGGSSIQYPSSVSESRRSPRSCVGREAQFWSILQTRHDHHCRRCQLSTTPTFQVTIQEYSM